MAATDTLTTLSAEAQTMHDTALLMVAEQSQVFYDSGQKQVLRKNAGNTVSWRRFETLTPTTTALTESVTPTSTALSVTEITGTVGQYGAVVEVSDMLDMVGVDPVISEVIKRIGQQAGESVETLVANVLKAGTVVQYATGASRGAQIHTSPITIAMIRKAVRTLDTANTQRFNGPTQNSKVGQGEYKIFVHPKMVYDLKNDSEWKTHQQQSPGYEKLYNGEIGMVEGCRVIQSTLCPIFSAAGSGGDDVHGALIMGQGAFGVTDVASTGKFETIVKQLGSGGTYDPLNQRATIGWKSQFLSKILNNSFMVRIEAGVST